MHRLFRRRVASGLLGLLALTLSLAEAGAASLCDPSMPMHPDGEVVANQQNGRSADVAAHGAATHRSNPDAPGVSEDGTDPPPCPWMPMMGAGCTAPVVAPAVSTGLDAAAGRSVVAFRAVRDLASLYSTDPLLPPPRA